MENYKIKSSVVKSIMNNPNLRRAIEDSLSSPIGSTKRTKAKSILSAFNKVAPKNDGQGGPGLTLSNPTTFNFSTSPSGIQTPSYSNIKIFPSTPDPQKNTSLSNWSNLSGGNSSLNTNNISQSTKDLFKGYNDSVIKPGANISSLGSYSDAQKQKLLTSLNMSSGNNALSNANPAAFGAMFGKDKLTSLMNTLNSLNGGSASLNKPATKNTVGQNKISTGATEGPTYTPTGTTGTTGTTGSGAYSGDAAIQAQWDALSPADQKKYKPVFDAAYSKLGAGTFFYGAMSDKKLLKQLFPGLRDEDLPTGASLAGQMADLQKTLKTQYGLDDLLAQKTQLANESGNFTQDMTDYISGRDQFLGSVNKMIEGAEDKVSSIDTPYAANTMKNYLNYLYVLKGRQSKNYVDYLNSAVTYQNNKISQVNNEYTNMVNAYNTDFKTQSDLKTADYNQWQTVLTDMYNKLDGALSTQLDLQTKQAAIDKTYSDIAIDAATAAAKTSTIDNTQNPTIKDFLIDSNSDTKGQLLQGVDLASVIARAQNQGLDPQGVLDTFQIGARTSISAAKDNVSNLNNTMNNITNTLKSFNQTTNGQYSNIIKNIAQGLGQQTQSSISSYVENNGDAVVDAVKDLGSWRNKNSADFVKNHSNIDPTFAKQLFSYYQSNPEYAEKPQALFSSTGKLKTSDIPTIKDVIAKSLANTWSNNIVTSINQE